ncbi:Ribosomal L1 domain-containing protein 1, partial [Coemansia sp. RSA 788]
KIPAPVNLRAKNLRNEIGKALKCTYYKAARGSCNSVRVGTTDMAPAMLIENTMGTLDNLVKHIPKGWDNIQSVGIKTGTSLTLPIYNALPNASTVISNAAADDDEAMEDVEGETEGAEKKEKKEKASKKSKKSPLSRTKAKNIVKAHAKKRAEATA